MTEQTIGIALVIVFTICLLGKSLYNYAKYMEWRN